MSLILAKINDTPKPITTNNSNGYALLHFANYRQFLPFFVCKWPVSGPRKPFRLDALMVVKKLFAGRDYQGWLQYSPHIMRQIARLIAAKLACRNQRSANLRMQNIALAGTITGNLRYTHHAGKGYAAY
jgi:hypothetical protein